MVEEISTNLPHKTRSRTETCRFMLINEILFVSSILFFPFLSVDAECLELNNQKPSMILMVVAQSKSIVYKPVSQKIQLLYGMQSLFKLKSFSGNLL